MAAAKTKVSASTAFSLPFLQTGYVSIFPHWANYVGFWRLISLHMATALLIATSKRTAAWQPVCQNHHQKRWGVERGGQKMKGMCVCPCTMCTRSLLRDRRRAARRKEKLARENKVNEAWRRLPSPVYCQRQSCLLIHCYHHSRGKVWRKIPPLLAGWGWQQVEKWSGYGKTSLVSAWCVFWLKQHMTHKLSIPRMSEQTLACRMHLHFPQSNWIFLDSQRPPGCGVSRGHSAHNRTMARFWAVANAKWLVLLVDWLLLGKREMACNSLNSLLTRV